MKRPVSSRPRAVRRRSPRGFGAGAAALLAAACAVACGGGGGADGGGPVFGVLTAMPSELGAVLEHVAVDDVREVDGRWFHSGRIGSTPVVVAMTGVGLENARATTRTLVATFDVAGVVVSGVATSPFGIGDVTVAARWRAADGTSVAVDGSWLDRVRAAARQGRIMLEHCTEIPGTLPIPDVSAGERVCLAGTPRVVVGGYGWSSDESGGSVASCISGGDDVFACDDGTTPAAPPRVGEAYPAPLLELAAEDEAAEDEAADDMETTAVAEEAVAAGLPFVAFRASSDGGDDPLALSGFLEFFAYYRLAARNAASAAAVFLGAGGPA